MTVKIPPEMLLVGIQHFPFKNRNVLNFFIQGIAVFIVSMAVGYFVGGHFVISLCR